jgi:hypothetical protein
MTATLEAPQESEVDAGELVTRTEDLADEVKADIIAQREAGTTLAELKANFPQVAPDVIRAVLPAGNARERKAKVTEVTKGTGGRSGKAKSQPKPKPKVEAKAEPASRYAEGKEVVDLAERTLAARQVVGRNRLAELLETTGSAVWRAEQGRIHEDEVDGLKAGLDVVEKRIAAGEFVKAAAEPKAKQASKAELQQRVVVGSELVRSARSDKSITKATLIDSALAVLNPTNAPKA